MTNALTMSLEPISAEPTPLMIQPLFVAPPEYSKCTHIGDDIYWSRLPLDSVLDHVNVYMIAGTDGWTIIDTGNSANICRQAFEAMLTNLPFDKKSIRRVIVTHYHPDHIGLAGSLAKLGAEILMSRSCWLYSRLLREENHPVPLPEQVKFVRAAGLDGLEMEAFIRRPASRYHALVEPIPYCYTRVQHGDAVSLAGASWDVTTSDGHAVEQISLWLEDRFAIVGDTVLPGITTNLSVHPSEPASDLVSPWLASLKMISQRASSETICLPGHGIPFKGITTRCEQLVAAQKATLLRLLHSLKRPSTAIDCLSAIYRRDLRSAEKDALIAEAVGFLNHLQCVNLVRSDKLPDGRNLWSRTRPHDDPMLDSSFRIDPDSRIAGPSFPPQALSQSS